MRSFAVLAFIIFILMSYPASAWTEASNQTNTTNYSFGITLNSTYFTSFTTNIATSTTKLNPYSITTSGLVGWWKLDSGSLIDSSSYANNGAGSGDLHCDISGKYNNACAASGAGIMNVTHQSQYNFGTGDFTVSMWIKPNSTTATIIAGKDNNTAPLTGWYVQKNTDNTINWGTRNSGSENTITSTTPITTTRYHHVVLTRTSGIKRIYIDGVVESTTSNDGSKNINSVNHLQIGGINGAPRYNGSIDDFKLYNRALSATEIREDYLSRIEQLRIRSNANTTYSSYWNSSGDNAVSIAYGANESITDLMFEAPTQVTQNSTIIYEYNRTAEFRPQPNIGSSLQLVSPENTATVNGVVTLKWYASPISSPNQYSVATDSGMIYISARANVTPDSNSVSTATPSLLLPQKYYWKVDTSNIFEFTLINPLIGNGDGTSGIQGITYNSQTLDGVAGAVVTITNLTWSDVTISNADGYYSFNNLENESLYSIKATAKNYVDSEVALVTTINGTWIVKNLLLQPCVSSFTCNINQQFTKFTVQSLWFTKYENVEAKVYTGTDLTQAPVYTSSTGSDGVVNFWLIKDQLYTITFINSTQGISQTWKGYPPLSGAQYIITSATTSGFYTLGSDEAQNVNVTVNTSTINATHAYVNVSYEDTLSQTSNLLFYLNQSIAGNLSHQTNLQSIDGNNNSTYNASFIVSNYGGQSYIATVKATHTTYGALSFSYGVQFAELPSPFSNFNPTSILILAVGLILFIAGIFGQTTASQGAGIIVGFCWILQGIAIFTAANVGTSFILALTLATIIVIIMNINERAKREGLS